MMKEPFVAVVDGKIKMFAARHAVVDQAASAPARATIYELLHEYDEDDPDNVKSLGLYSSLSVLEIAKTYFAEQPGFRDYPEAFIVQERLLDLLAWPEGFAKV